MIEDLIEDLIRDQLDAERREADIGDWCDMALRYADVLRAVLDLLAKDRPHTEAWYYRRDVRNLLGDMLLSKSKLSQGGGDDGSN